MLLGRKLILIAALLFLALVVGRIGARGASFTASLDRDTIALGETATLSLSFDDGQPKNVPTPDVPGLRFSGAGSSQHFSVINGAMNSTVSIAFSVMALRPGEFVIPAITVDVNGQSLTSEPLKLTVTQPSAVSAEAAASGSEVAFMKLIMPREKIYVGQTVTAQMQVFLRDDVRNFGNLQIPAVTLDGFQAGKTAEGSRFRTQVGDRVYTVVPVVMALTATRAGTLTLGPVTANLVIVLATPAGGDPIAQFFNQGEQKQISLASDQVTVASLALPAENVPPAFNGAIGNYTLRVAAGPTNVTVGDPITVRIQIAGHGALDDIKLPEQSWNDFKTFPPTQKTETSDGLGLDGKKIFEEIVTPQNADVHGLPPFAFSFFNPDDGRYHTLTQPGMPLAVRSAGAAPALPLTAGKNPAGEHPQDIAPIKETLGTIGPVPAPLLLRPVFVAVQTVPVMAFLAALVWRRRADAQARNPRMQRRLQVERLVRAGLIDLKRAAAENQPDEFFSTLFRLLQEQLGERLDCPASSITEAAIDEDLARRGVPEDLLAEWRELFQRCNQARYAPVRGAGELNSVAEKFEQATRRLREVVRS